MNLTVYLKVTDTEAQERVFEGVDTWTEDRVLVINDEKKGISTVIPLQNIYLYTVSLPEKFD